MAGLPRAINDLANCFARLPGIGPKSANRLAFYLVNAPESFVAEMASSFVRIKSEVRICQKCSSVSDEDICDICGDVRRKQNLICVVERPVDVVALEKVGGFVGVYHVLGGVLNPLEHIGPEELRINELILRITDLNPSQPPFDKGGEESIYEKDVEIILAMNPTMEGEATSLYIKKKIESLGLENIKITRIGSGLPIGADLEFADQVTLSRAMEGRKEM